MGDSLDRWTGPDHDDDGPDQTDILPVELVQPPDRVDHGARPGVDRGTPGGLVLVVRAAAAGVDQWRTKRSTWRTEPLTANQWKLDHHGPTGKAPNPKEHEALEVRIAAELQQRAKRHQSQAWTAAGVVLFTVAVAWFFMVWLFLVAALVAVATGLGFALAGRSAVQATGDADWSGTGTAGQGDVLAAQWSGLICRTELDRDTVEGVLRTKGLLKDGRAIECGPVRPMGPGGRTIEVLLPEDLPATEVIAKKHGIATALNTDDNLLTLKPIKGSGRLLSIGMFDTDPMAGPPNASPLAAGKRIDVWDGIPFGTTDTGLRVRLGIVGTSLLIAGATGAGKTDAGRLPALGYALDPDASSILLDPEGFGAWSPFSRVATVISGSSPESRRAMAEMLVWVATEEFERRQRAIQAYAERVPMGLATSAVTRDIARDRAAGLQPLLVGIDECHALFTDLDAEIRKMATWACVQIISRGRKYAISLELTTQKATGNNIPTSIRALAGTRFCMAVDEVEMANAVLKKGWAAAGMDPLSLIADENAGAGYLQGIGLPKTLRPWARLRTDWVDTNGLGPIIEAGYKLQLRYRPELLPVSALPAPPPANIWTPVDLEPLRHLAAIFEPVEALTTAVIVERLKANYPGDHDDLAPRRATVNRFLAQYDLKLSKLVLAGGRDWAVRQQVVQAALDRLDGQVDGVVDAGRTGQDVHPPSTPRPGASPRRETLADLPFPTDVPMSTPISGEAPNSPGGRPWDLSPDVEDAD